VLVLAALLLAAAPAAAQTTRAEILLKVRQEKAARLEPHTPGTLEKRLVKFENDRTLEGLVKGADRGFFPRFGSLVSGAGIAFGGGYRDKSLFGQRATFTVSSAVSLKKYWLAEVGLEMPRLANGRLFAEVNAVKRDFPQQDFFGLGAESLRSDISNYAYRDLTVGGFGGVRVTPALSIGGGLEFVRPSIGSGKDKASPTTEALFADAEAPGLVEQPNFMRYSTFVDFNYRQPIGNPRRGGRYRLDYHVYDDRDLSRYSFSRLDLEVQQYFPFLNDRRVIALRGVVSTADAGSGQRVPFYLMRWLGGNKTLRGFRNYRFQGENLILLQAEYRWEIFPAFDAALFYDAGKVERDRADLNLKHLESDYGFGFRFGTLEGVFLRIDAAFGSADGKHFHFGFSHVF
jgi:outer membrane protein assembly factor BamA